MHIIIVYYACDYAHDYADCYADYNAYYHAWHYAYSGITNMIMHMIVHVIIPISRHILVIVVFSRAIAAVILARPIIPYGKARYAGAARPALSTFCSGVPLSLPRGLPEAPTPPPSPRPSSAGRSCALPPDSSTRRFSATVRFGLRRVGREPLCR